MKRVYSFTAQLIIGGFLVAGCKSESPSSSVSASHASESSSARTNMVKDQHSNAPKTQEHKQRRSYEEQRRLLEEVTLNEENASISLQDIDANILQSNVALTIRLATEEFDGNCYFSISYPQLEGLNSTSIEAKVNTMLRGQVFNFLHDWNERNEVGCSLEVDEQQTIPEYGYYAYVEVDQCLIGYSRERLLSGNCRVIISSGASPLLYDQPFTIDLATG
ncbi:hypothetical protein [Vacuolonema iberomarrocanum]|uniref:hypothetical protein n=1 Tax=Vacuolonema iberomarrocanum TaxID=3454632 RepID=UPI0019F138DD|nr:hypothetical protein [filamentous cyanobacterium LEGE 07170]